MQRNNGERDLLDVCHEYRHGCCPHKHVETATYGLSPCTWSSTPLAACPCTQYPMLCSNDHSIFLPMVPHPSSAIEATLAHRRANSGLSRRLPLFKRLSGTALISHAFGPSLHGCSASPLTCRMLAYRLRKPPLSISPATLFPCLLVFVVRRYGCRGLNCEASEMAACLTICI